MPDAARGTHPRRSSVVADAVEVLVVQVEGVSYGFLLADVSEVLPAVASVPLPGGPEVIEGLLNMRGNLVPLLDLRARLQLPPRPAEPEDHLVVCHVAGRRVAVRVDRAEGILAIPADALEDLEHQTAHLGGVARTADGILLVYDVDSFLSAEEASRMYAAIADAAGDR